MEGQRERESQLGSPAVDSSEPALDIDGEDVAYFWRMMAAENIASTKQDYNSTHPSSAERFGNIEAAFREVRHKKETNQPLLPNRKP